MKKLAVFMLGVMVLLVVAQIEKREKE